MTNRHTEDARPTTSTTPSSTGAASERPVEAELHDTQYPSTRREDANRVGAGPMTNSTDAGSRPQTEMHQGEQHARQIKRTGQVMSRPSPGVELSETGPVRTPRNLLRILLADVRHGRWLLVLSTLLAACASGASVALMGVSAWLLSRAAEMPPVLYLEAAAVGVRFFGISRGVFRYAERLVGHDLALRMQGVLRMRSYNKLSGTTLVGRRRGDLLVRVTADVEAILDVVVRVLVPACAASLAIIGTTALLARFSPASAAWLLGSALLAGVVIPWLTQVASRRADGSTVPLRGELANRTRELAHAAPDLVALNAADHQMERVLEVDAKLRDAERRAAWVRGLGTAGQILAAGVAVVSALLVGGQAVADGRIGGRILAVLVLTPRALHEVFGSFNAAAQTFTRARTALNRIVEILDAPTVGVGDSPTAESTGQSPSLELTDLTVGWPDSGLVQRHLDLQIHPGESVALVGPSGIGKTTIAATIMGLIPPMSGQVHTTGRVRYLAQNAHVFTTSIAENVRIGARQATDEEVVTALQRAGLDLPPDRLVGEDGATISGGEAQRLALARVLVTHATSAGDGEAHEPTPVPNTAPGDVLILDEPTEHLDVETSEALMDDLWATTPGAAKLVITHDPLVMERCDRVWELG